MRDYPLLPSVPDAGLLTRYLDTLAVFVPLARTNRIANGSLEYNADNWTTRFTVASAARVTTQSYHGAYSYEVTPSTAATMAAMYGAAGGGGSDGPLGTFTPIANSVNVFSCKVRGALGVPYRLFVENNSGPVEIASYGFTGTGRWQWVWLVYTEGGSPTGQRNHWVGKNNSRDGSPFYIDGLQVETVTDGYYVPTTFIDGDQVGLVPNQFPPAYGWNGLRGASTSYRSGQTRAGGRVVRFRDFGYYLTAILGLGLAPPLHHALTFAQLDGGQYQNTIKPPRQFSLAGRVGAANPTMMDAGIGGLGRVLDRDLVAQRQPLVLTMQAEECGVPVGERITIPALYAGGLEGNIQETPTQQLPITFQQYTLPVFGHDQGVALDAQDSIASPGGILGRAPTGTWTTLGTGVSGGSVNVILAAPNGLVYVGGSFTAAGATGADFIASYNPQTGAWDVLNSATALNGEVDAIVAGPDGRIYVGGNFTNASGIAAADFIAVWNPVSGTWAAVGTGTNGRVRALAWVGTTLYAGGDFTTAGGGAAARVAGWNGSLWSALGSGAGATVRALAAGPGNILYIAGDFTNGGGVATADRIGKWQDGVWFGLSTGMDDIVYALAVAPNGVLYAAGQYTTAGGIAAGGLAAWNGVRWQPVGQGWATPGAFPTGLAVRGDGTLLIGANAAVVDPGNPGPILEWNGSAYVSLGIVLSGVGGAVALAPDGTIYAATSSGATAIVSGVVTATNSGSAFAYPTIVIQGPSSGIARIYELIDATTGAAIYINYTMAAGEILTLTLDPTNITFVSSFQGNILRAILPGSELTTFAVQPGANRILFLAEQSSVAVTMRWPIGYVSANDALYQS